MTLPDRTAARLPFPVSAVCFGTSPLGSMPATYGYEVGEAQARETIRAILSQPASFIDTSRNYGMGRSEERIGAVIEELGGLPHGCVLATKIDRDMQTNRLDVGRARRSVEESLRALRLDRLDILHLHDPEYCRDLGEITGSGGALDALFEMKAEGLVKAVGLAMGELSLMMQILADWEFDALVNHNRFTLLNREAEAMYAQASARGIAIFNAAPYCGGALAKGSAGSARITYQEVTDEGMAPVRAVEAVCARHGVPLGAAALQFSMRDARITSTICGVSRPERVAQTVEWAEWPIPRAAWDELLALPYATDDPEAGRAYLPG